VVTVCALGPPLSVVNRSATVSPGTTLTGLAVLVDETATFSVVTVIAVPIAVTTPFLTRNIEMLAVLAGLATIVPTIAMALKVQATGMITETGAKAALLPVPEMT
jgi:hypothetical protein